jgi:hypothetical protein
MAVYYSALIKQDIIGSNTNVSTSQPSSPLKQLLNNVGNEKYVISSLNIWSDNFTQLIQPIKLIRKTIDGKEDSHTVVPSVDNYQKQSILNNISLDNFEFNEDTKFEYSLLGDTNVKLTLNFDEAARKKLSVESEMLGVDPDEKGENIVPDLSDQLKLENEYEEGEPDKKLIQEQKKQKQEQQKKKPSSTKTEKKKAKTNFWWITGIALLTYMIIKKSE